MCLSRFFENKRLFDRRLLNGWLSIRHVRQYCYLYLYFVFLFFSGFIAKNRRQLWQTHNESVRRRRADWAATFGFVPVVLIQTGKLRLNHTADIPLQKNQTNSTDRVLRVYRSHKYTLSSHTSAHVYLTYRRLNILYIHTHTHIFIYYS